jgi:hypothetical protein
MKTAAVCWSAVLGLLVPGLAPAKVTQFVVESRELINGGASYGQAGPYERIRGYAVGELDPFDRRNAGIVNLDKAPRNASGRVAYRTDVEIHKPVELRRGNGTLLYDVVNRGNPLVPSFINGNTTLTMDEGFTVVWNGWQGDLQRVGQNLIATFPIATDNGAPIVGLSREEFVDRGTGTWVGALQYPAATLDQSKATLTVRERERDARQPITSWQYLNDRQIQVTHPGAPFDSGAIFEFIYPAKEPIVAGMGFAATRDVNSFLLHEKEDSLGNANPLAGRHIRRAMAMGVSQSGRFLRDFLYQGFNEDERGRKVFDGAMPIIPGSRKTWTNFEFAQPGRWSKQHEEHLQPGDQFPFAYNTIRDPLTGKTGGVLAKCRLTHTCPKVMHVDGEYEVWGARGSLLLTDGDPDGPEGLELPRTVRLYMVAGLPHGGSNLIVPATLSRGMCKNYPSPLGSRDVNRALLLALNAWITSGREPPESRYGTVSEKHHRHGRHGHHKDTLVRSDRESTGFPEIPGVTYNGLFNYIHVTDYSVVPPQLGAEYGLLVPRVDRDGNSLAGIRLPALEAPIATYTGWNLRAPGFAEDEMCASGGSYIPFAQTAGERRSTGDPRRAIAERYRDHNEYVRKFSRAAAKLVREGYLLPQDAAAQIEQARALDIGLPKN